MMYIRKFKSEGVNYTVIIKLFFVLVLINALLRLFGIFVPIALLFGPLHYYLHRLSQGRSAHASWLFHLLPFIFVCLLFPLYGAPLYLTVLLLSSLIYSIYAWISKDLDKTNSAEKIIVLQVAAVSMVGSVFIALLLLSSIGRIQWADLNFDPSYVVYGLLLVASTVLFGYLVENNPASSRQEEPFRSGGPSSVSKNYAYNIDVSVLENYARQIESVIDEKKLFLNAALSMDDLLHETGIPKHHLSQVFTVFVKKPFYQYIAEKRVEEAKLRMKHNANITIEFLAFECGFNSKTTFNKYFKQFSSITPSEYRSSLILDN